MIRPAVPEDVDDLIALLQLGHKLAGDTLEVALSRARHVLMQHIVRSDHFSWVSQRNVRLGGALFASLEEPWYSRERIATDLFFYARDGSGARLLKQFLAWAEGVAAKEVWMGVSVGIEDPERVSKLLERAGLPRVGGLHRKVI